MTPYPRFCRQSCICNPTHHLIGLNPAANFFHSSTLFPPFSTSFIMSNEFSASKNVILFQIGFIWSDNAMQILSLFLTVGASCLSIGIFGFECAGSFVSGVSFLFLLLEFVIIFHYIYSNVRKPKHWWKPIIICLVFNFFMNMVYLGLWKSGLT